MQNKRPGERSRRDLVADFILGTLSVASVLIGWEVLVRTNILPVQSVSSPSLAFAIIARDGYELLTGLCGTIVRAGAGFSVGFLIAIPTAYLMAQSGTVKRLLRPVVEFLRPLPSSVMILVAAVLFGIGWESEVAVVAFGSIWPLLINTYDGLSNIPRETGDVLKLLKLSRWNEVKFVYSRLVLPSLVSGARISASIAIILAITFEMFLGGAGGLGQYLMSASQTGYTNRVYAGVVVAGIGGLAVNAFVSWFCDGILRRAFGPSR